MKGAYASTTAFVLHSNLYLFVCVTHILDSTLLVPYQPPPGPPPFPPPPPPPPLSAADHIRRGEVDLMLAGASDAAVIPTGLAGFMALRALSRRNDEPEKASRPWDRARDGFVLGEGAGG